MPGISFEWTIKFGDLLTVVSALVIAAAFLHKRGGQEASVQVTLTELAKDFGEMKDQMMAFSKAISDIAVQRVEINLLMKWYDELRRGEGFVRGGRGIDREYSDENGKSS